MQSLLELAAWEWKNAWAILGICVLLFFAGIRSMPLPWEDDPSVVRRGFTDLCLFLLSATISVATPIALLPIWIARESEVRTPRRLDIFPDWVPAWVDEAIYLRLVYGLPGALTVKLGLGVLFLFVYLWGWVGFGRVPWLGVLSACSFAASTWFALGWVSVPFSVFFFAAVVRHELKRE